MPSAVIPGPSGPDMLRGFRQMRRHPPEFLMSCADRFGPVVSFPIPRSSVIYLANPADVRRVLQANHRNYSKQTIQYQSLALVTGNGLLASDGEVWRQMRRVLQPAFHSDLIGGMTEAIQEPVRRLVAQTEAEPLLVEDLDALMLQLTMEMVGATLFGSQLDDEARELVQAVSVALHVVVARAQLPIRPPSWLPTRGKGRLASSKEMLDQAVTRLIETSRKNEPGSDALSLLLAARDDGFATDTEVRDEVVTLIVAGHETVAATLTWTWLLLAANPVAMKQLQQEVDALSWPSDLRLPTDLMAQIPFTRAVVDEALRLYPPAWAISRKSVSPDVLGGYEVPANTTVITSPYALHRDERLWVDPAEFLPERFLGEAPDRSVYLPFGAGPRLCVGRDLAVFEVPLVVAALVRAVHIQPRPRGPVGRDFGVTLRPDRRVPAVLKQRRR